MKAQSGITLAAIAAAGLLLSGTSFAATPGSSAAPVRIGVVVTLSGPLAQIGNSHLAGATLAANEINAKGGADGHKIELVRKDERVNPQATVTAVRELLGDNIKLMIGLTTDADCLAAAPLVNRGGGVLIGTSCQSNLLETSKFVPAFFEIAPTNYMLAKATAGYAHEHFASVKSWDGIGPDYEFGKEVWQSFREDLHSLDPAVTFRKNVFVPLTENQFAAYISSLLSGLPSDSATTNGLFMSLFSAPTIGLAKQGKPQNLFGRYAAILNLGGSNPTAQALGADTPSMYFIYDYTPTAYHNPTNTSFVSAFESAHNGDAPNAWNYEGYTAITAYAEAIEQAHSVDPETLRHTLAGMTFDTPKGRLTFRKEDHLLMSPVTVWHVVGDASAPEGFRVVSSEAVPAEKVLPPVKLGK